ncbi:MAG: hypothetical protein M3Q32_14285 [Pseudomonadota bacterium]|nr:hypothetical protein [Pseudomonadota bacterium]
MKSKHSPLMDKIQTDKDLSADSEKELAEAMTQFKANAVY